MEEFFTSIVPISLKVFKSAEMAMSNIVFLALPRREEVLKARVNNFSKVLNFEKVNVFLATVSLRLVVSRLNIV